MERDADGSRGDASGGIGVFRELARHPELSTWRASAQRVLPYVVGAAMFGIAVWVLHSTLRRYHLADLHAELVELTLYQVGLAILFTFCSFLALIGYEWSALGPGRQAHAVRPSGDGLVRDPVDRAFDRLRLRHRRHLALPLLLRPRPRHRRRRQGPDVLHRHLHARRRDAGRRGGDAGALAARGRDRPAAVAVAARRRRRRSPW